MVAMKFIHSAMIGFLASPFYPFVCGDDVPSSPVVMTEVSSKGTSDGTCDGNDWVELFNPTDGDINLGNFLLHDDNGAGDEDAFTFPDPTIISAMSYHIVCCDGDYEGDSDNANFKIGGDDEVTLLDASGNLVSTSGVMGDDHDEDRVWARSNDGAFLYSNIPTPLAANRFSPVVMTEVSSKGTSDGTCDGNDWVELFNPTDGDINLGNFLLHDDNGAGDEDAFTFPDPTIISAMSYHIVCCDGDYEGDSDNANFKIGGDDEVTLLDASGNLVSTSGVMGDDHDEDRVWARSNDGAFLYSNIPTPLAANSFSSEGVVEEEEFSFSYSFSSEGAFEEEEEEVVTPTAIVISEVSDKGTSDGTCGGEDWVELKNVQSDDVDLSGWVLHDDKGIDDGGAFTFPNGITLAAGAFAVFCCNGDGVSAPSFKVGGDDTVTLVSPSGEIASTTGALPDLGMLDQTYAYNSDTNGYQYTGDPTPNSPNSFTDNSDPSSLLPFGGDLVAQNEAGNKFFGYSTDGATTDDSVEGFFGHVIDIKLSMDETLFNQMWEDQSYEVWTQWDSLEVMSPPGGGETVVFDHLKSGGRIRPRGQSTLAFGTCLGYNAIPFLLDLNHNNISQTLFGAEKVYFRNHLLDGSYMRDWSMHKMLQRFGLPYLRTRKARFYINDMLMGLYDVMEAPDQEYVFRRSFPDYDPTNYALFKVKTNSIECGRYSEDTLDLPMFNNVEPPYTFERGEHREKIEVFGKVGDNPFLHLAQCSGQFSEMMGREYQSTMAAYNNYNRNCGEMLVGEGLIDRDLGTSTLDQEMKEYINSNLGAFDCSDAMCSNSDLASDVDVDQWLKNIAVYAVTVGQDSIVGNGNNYFLANSGDGNGWKIVQYDHNNVAEGIGATLCDEKCAAEPYAWSIKHPACESPLSSNPRIGPLLVVEDNMNIYLEYVRSFVTDILNDESLIDSFKAHFSAIASYAEVDDWNWYGGDSNSMLQTQNDPDNWNAGGQFPLLSFYAKRAESVLDQLADHDAGNTDTHTYSNLDKCVSWGEEPVEIDWSWCQLNCKDATPCYTEGCQDNFDEVGNVWSGVYDPCNYQIAPELCAQCVQDRVCFTEGGTVEAPEGEMCSDSDSSTWPAEFMPLIAVGGCPAVGDAQQYGIFCDTDLATNTVIQGLAPGVSGTFRDICCETCYILEGGGEGEGEEEGEGECSACADAAPCFSQGCQAYWTEGGGWTGPYAACNAGGFCAPCFSTGLCGAPGGAPAPPDWGDDVLGECSVMGTPVGTIGTNCCSMINAGAVAVISSSDRPAASAGLAQADICATPCFETTLLVLEGAGSVMGITGIIQPFEDACAEFRVEGGGGGGGGGGDEEEEEEEESTLAPTMATMAPTMAPSFAPTREATEQPTSKVTEVGDDDVAREPVGNEKMTVTVESSLQITGLTVDDTMAEDTEVFQIVADVIRRTLLSALPDLDGKSLDIEILSIDGYEVPLEVDRTPLRRSLAEGEVKFRFIAQTLCNGSCSGEDGDRLVDTLTQAGDGLTEATEGGEESTFVTELIAEFAKEDEAVSARFDDISVETYVSPTPEELADSVDKAVMVRDDPGSNLLGAGCSTFGTLSTTWGLIIVLMGIATM